MATEMTSEELTAAKAGARVVDTYEARDGDDDYIIAELHEMRDGRRFRYVESSGMDSALSGAGDFGEWLEPSEYGVWNQF